VAGKSGKGDQRKKQVASRAPSGRGAGTGGAGSGLMERWPRWVATASAVGLLLGSSMIALSLYSVSLASQFVPGNTTDPLDYRAKGSATAPVVVADWFDYQCPACRILALSREPELEKEYVSTGKVRYVSRNYAFLGPESFLAAEASECAADQGRYWDYRTLLFQRQQGENRGAFRTENLKRFAGELGLNQSSFDGCVDSRKYRDAIVAETKEGEELGVNATPTLFINGKQQRGAPAMDRLRALIDEELAKK